MLFVIVTVTATKVIDDDDDDSNIHIFSYVYMCYDSIRFSLFNAKMKSREKEKPHNQEFLPQSTTGRTEIENPFRIELDNGNHKEIKSYFTFTNRNIKKKKKHFETRSVKQSI